VDVKVQKSGLRGFAMISQTAEYALRAVVALGRPRGGPATTQQIAAETQIPAGYLSKILQALGRSGLVTSQRGPGGGYVLTRSLDELTVLDVVNAVDPLRRIERCPLGLPLHEGRLCALHGRLDRATALVESYFRETTIGQLLNEPRPGRGLCDRPGGDAE
jgi:Rrf2 family transcriptional regulator, nitric oxide-sensitive transcriptional repressor